MNRFTSLFFALMVMGFCACSGDKEPVEEEPIRTEEELRCEDVCVFAFDGECDDGGPNAISNFCEFGMDCSDCGQRVIIKIKR